MGRDRDKDSNGEDGRLFRDAIGKVRPVKGRPLRRPPAPPPRARSRRADEREALRASLDSPPAGADIQTGEELSFRRAGLAERDFRKLRRGGFSIQEEIDLHGWTAGEAREVLQLFLEHAREKQLRCVRVVHGKGRHSRRELPVIKDMVNRELRRWDCVLAFCSAQPRHGGTGAVYVLLRRQR